MAKVVEDSLNPRLIHFSGKEIDHLPILSGPPESVSMRSGLVHLSAGKSVGKHSTENFEELIVVLEGKGQLQITGQKPLEIVSGVAVYCPPETEHNVVNTGNAPLRYLYVVAETKS
ncbi:MAG: cupin domain-containing protein [candidate division WOR-3 bacterium]|nr:cupin domain-containing protein [candidate division WOR-3 bacterium]